MDATFGSKARYSTRFSGSSPRDLNPHRQKRMKFDRGNGLSDATFSASWRCESDREKQKASSKLQDHSDPFSVNYILNELESGKFGSITKDIRDLLVRRRQLLDSLYSTDPQLPYQCLTMSTLATGPFATDVIDLEDDRTTIEVKRYPPPPVPSSSKPIVILDSDDEDGTTEKPIRPFQDVNLSNPEGFVVKKEFVELDYAQTQGGHASPAGETNIKKDKGEYVGVEDDAETEEINEQAPDGLDDIWNEFSFALETSKGSVENPSPDKHQVKGEEDCEHSFIMKEDIGEVCRICGVIGRGIESIIDFQFSKGSRNTRTYYKYEGRSSKHQEQGDNLLEGFNQAAGDFTVTEIHPHPRHKKEMKPHQIEGFNFLANNLISDNPGGCIMAHAPGSGKTFMIISFLQSFMAKYPFARPLVVLPRGILAIWKKEFLRWQVEDIPLYDFYSVKADSRSQQLDVLKQWAEKRSILFLGYKQFSSIVCDGDTGQTAAACQQILLKCPSILILDEGHTPRNQDTDVLTSLEKVQTTRKVVLSGTLYQNHVKEVFNILNLVRPRFLKLDDSKTIKRRILGRAEVRKASKTDNDFFELIERSLLRDENHTRKSTVIQDLRQMTRKVLHYYKGDNLDELPGLVDFSVFLRLSNRQRAEVKGLKSLARKFKISAEGSAIYVHPELKTLSKNSGVKDRVDEAKIDGILENLDVNEGVKGKFFLNLLRLCESNNEKMLVFSQYLLPLKFLERLTAKVKGYRLGKEMFMITGDSDSEMRESSMESFNTSPDARIFFGSIRACGEGISLVGASRIIILDVHLNPSVTRQAIGRAFRPGQLRKVYTYRLVASGSPEEEDHATCFRKESIAKLWFEWDERDVHHNFDMETVNVKECGDSFLEVSHLNQDIVSVSRR